MMLPVFVRASLAATALAAERNLAIALATEIAGGRRTMALTRRTFCIAAATATQSGSHAVAASTDVPDPDNIFGRILRGEAPAAIVDDERSTGGELFTFRDRNPASSLHLLVIPQRFIRDASRLQPADADLVRRMEAKARAVVRDEVGDAFCDRELALGFHWPPWYSVPWLHLHAIYPKSKMRRRYKYTGLTFKSPEYVLRRLERQAAGQMFW